MKKSTFLFVLLALMAFSRTTAQNKSNDTTARYFIIQASIGNLQEIAMARVAAAQATHPEVKAFASQMIIDHGKAEAELMQLIQARGYQIPREATETPVADIKLKNTPSKEFDAMYVHMMVSDHRETFSLFEKYALTGKDPDARAFAQQVLPVLKEHLDAIMTIDSHLKDSQ